MKDDGCGMGHASNSKSDESGPDDTILHAPPHHAKRNGMSEDEMVVSLELSTCPHCGKELRAGTTVPDFAIEGQGISTTTIFQDYVPDVKQIERGAEVQTSRRPVKTNDVPIRSRAAMVARRRGPRVFGVRPSFILITVCILVWSIVGIRWWIAQTPVEESVPAANQSWQGNRR